MAIDFQVVYPQESVQLNKVELTNGAGIDALDIRGQDFRSVDEVLINDLPSPDVIVVSKSQLLAQLPDRLQGAPGQVNTVMVLSKRLTVSERSIIRFRISDTPGRVRGLLRLIQLFLKTLFTTPGSDIFDQDAGGGALRKVGETFGADEGGNIVSSFVVSVNQTARQIVARQSRDSSLPLDERLMSARVIRANFDKNQGALFIGVELLSQAGQQAIANMEL